MAHNTTVIAPTSKGHRVYLDYLTSKGYKGRYNVHYSADHILVEFCAEGKRKLVLSKGGVADLEGKKVTQWAQGAKVARVDYHPITILIHKV